MFATFVEVLEQTRSCVLLTHLQLGMHRVFLMNFPVKLPQGIPLNGRLFTRLLNQVFAFKLIYYLYILYMGRC